MLDQARPLTTPRQVEELCDQFEAELRRGARPVLDEWMAKAGSNAEVALGELAALELEYRLRANETITAADYFARYPQLRTQPDAALRLIVAEYLAAAQHNPQVSATDFQRRYSDLAQGAEWSKVPWVRPAGEGEATDDSQLGALDTTNAPVAPQYPLTFLRTILTPADHPGELGRFGDYRVLDILGMGGMGIVLRAEEETLHRVVALKLMRPEVAAQPTAKARFLREARVAAAVVHARVVVIHHVGEVNGTPFLVMPLLAGQSLGQRLKTGPSVSVSETLQIARETAEGLAAAHERGLIHRDIKPDNIWLEKTPEGTHVRLLDFGLARCGEDEGLSSSGVVVGTANYMAPEQAAARPIDARADLFSLGCVLHELTTGRRAFTGPDLMAILSALANHHPPSPHAVNPAIPIALSDLVVRLLAKDPADRMQSAAEVVAALRAIEEGQPNPLPPIQLADTSDNSPLASPRRRRGLTVAAVLGLLGVLGLLVGLANRSPDQSRGEPGRDLAKEAPVDSVPLRVMSIAIDHFARLNNQEGERLGFLGKRSPEAKAPKLGDQVTVQAQLSRPAFAYLLAFRPDGEIELCSPATEDQPPTRDDQVRYPTKAESADLRYGLQEGTGLWVFAVVASDEPLPAYREWKSKRPLTWSAEPGGQGKVWWYDGDWLEQLSGSGTVRGERAKGEKALGPGKAVVQAADQLHVGNVVTAAIGFGVSPRD
jgi:serine/threonine protein kinase